MLKIQKGSTLIGIIVVIIVAAILGGGFWAWNYYTEQEQEAIGENQTLIQTPSQTEEQEESEEQTEPQTDETIEIIELTVWPDINSFDFNNGTFEAKGLGANAKLGKVKISTNNSTKYNIRLKTTIIGYDKLTELYFIVKNWVGPEWFFTIEGTTQEDGSILANEISSVSQ